MLNQHHAVLHEQHIVSSVLVIRQLDLVAALDGQLAAVEAELTTCGRRGWAASVRLLQPSRSGADHAPGVVAT